MEEKTLYLPTEHNDRIVAFIGSPLGLLAAWLVLINTVTFLIFGVDKLLAKHPRFRQRVPEKNLLLLAVAALVRALKRVDLPTLGKPTIPHFKLMESLSEIVCKEL